MSGVIFHNARIIGADRPIGRGWVQVRDGRIHQVGAGVPGSEVPGRRHDLAGAMLGPGFIDLHVHGAVGFEVMHAVPGEFDRMSGFFASHGVTGILATTYSSPQADLAAAVAAIAAISETALSGAAVLGSYLEGPYLNELRRGAHDARFLRSPDPDEIAALIALGGVNVVTHAPELPGSARFTEVLLAAGVTVAIGHTDATAAQTRAAADRGATLVTHTFNGMRGIHHRDPGTAGAALLNDDLICEVIADGTHVSRDMLALIWRVKGPGGIALITDGGPAQGATAGGNPASGEAGVVTGDVTRLPDGTISSSVRALDHGVRTLARAAGVRIEEVWECASAVPARAIGLQHRKGQVKQGFDADLTGLDADGRVVLTLVAGEIVYQI